jgi:N-acetyl-1-D-myo-inositol-2-amino-2-deoxy-alpha-D-glucopyranoside deacetylase
VAGVLARLVRDLRSTVVVVLDGSDGHRDHLHIRSAMHAVVRDLPEPRPTVVEHCLPNALMRRWLDEMRSVRPDAAYHSLDSAVLGRADADITDVVDVSDVLDRREAAMAEHRSQVSPYEGLSPELRRAFLATDHFARVDPA